MQATRGGGSSTSLQASQGPPWVLGSCKGQQGKRGENEEEEKTCFCHFEMLRWMFTGEMIELF